MSKDASSSSHGILFAACNIGASMAITVGMLFIAAVAFSFFALPRSVTGLLVRVITYACIALCGFRGGRKNRTNGLIVGAIYGLLYGISLFVVKCIVLGSLSANYKTLLSILICAAFGSLGGIIGVNTIKTRR